MKKRLFIAIDLPDEIKNRIKLLPQNNLRCVPQENLHITVLFIGYVDEEQTTEIKNKISKVTAGIAPFTVKFKDIIFAPPKKQFRMVWAVFEKNPEFEKLNRNLADALQEFHPDIRDELNIHVTLARFKKPMAKQELEKIVIPKGKNDEIKAERITLFESQLKQGGPVYTKISDFPLT